MKSLRVNPEQARVLPTRQFCRNAENFTLRFADFWLHLLSSLEQVQQQTLRKECMTPTAIELIIRAADARITKGTHDDRDMVIVAMYSAFNVEQAKVKTLREELDKERAINAQSAESIADLSTRLAMAPKALH